MTAAIMDLFHHDENNIEWRMDSFLIKAVFVFSMELALSTEFPSLVIETWQCHNLEASVTDGVSTCGANKVVMTVRY